MDWENSVQGYWPHGHSVLDTPLQTRRVFVVALNAGTNSTIGGGYHLAGIPQLAHTKNHFTAHITVLPGLQRREHCCSHYFGLP